MNCVIHNEILLNLFVEIEVVVITIPLSKYHFIIQ